MCRYHGDRMIIDLFAFRGPSGWHNGFHKFFWFSLSGRGVNFIHQYLQKIYCTGNQNVLEQNRLRKGGYPDSTDSNGARMNRARQCISRGVWVREKTCGYLCGADTRFNIALLAPLEAGTAVPPRSASFRQEGAYIRGNHMTLKSTIAYWKQKAHTLKRETYTIYLAYKDPRVPWYARLLAACVVGYAFSPIDLIPDPIPVLGYLDDLILIPLGIALVVKMIPADVLADCRKRAAAELDQNKPKNWWAAAVIIAIWVLLFLATISYLARYV